MRPSNIVLIISLLLFSCTGITIDGVLQKYNEETVPYISVEELTVDENSVILDTREKEEFDVSRIPGAIWVGYEEFDVDQVSSQLTSANTPIVVYCSVGVRSEDIGEKLLKAGYSNVRNLYGGIFQWKNSGHIVVDSTASTTENVHAYSKYWGRLLTEANKVY